jgi:hypothetical protein
MDPAARYQEILRRLAIIDESAVEQHAGLGLGLPRAHLLDATTDHSRTARYTGSPADRRADPLRKPIFLATVRRAGPHGG